MKPKLFSRGSASVEVDPLTDVGQPDSEFGAAIDDFCRAARMGADRPEVFWRHQHAAIMGRIRPSPQPVWRIGLSSALATALVLLGFSLFLFRAPARPAPDYAGGYDQELLLDVERALDREVPSALEPALLLSDEIAQNRNKKPNL